MPSDIVLAINALIKSGKQEGDPLNFPTFETIDIYPVFEHAFSEKAKVTLSHKTDSLIHQYNRPVHGASHLVMLGKLGVKSCADFKDKDPKEMWVRDFDKVNFIGNSATKEKLPLAIENVIKTINDVADRGFTKAHLVQLTIVPFAVANSIDQEFGVVSYITLTREGEDYVTKNMPNMILKEGYTPTKVE